LKRRQKQFTPNLNREIRNECGDLNLFATLYCNTYFTY
jgi:hypothetical protein